MSGIHQTHPSPQRTPVLFQAGGSKSGINFAAKHAEAIFVMDWSAAKMGEVVREMRLNAAKNGRDPQSLKVCAFQSISISVSSCKYDSFYLTELPY